MEFFDRQCANQGSTFQNSIMYLDACTTYSGKCAKEKKKLHGEEEGKGREKNVSVEFERGKRESRAYNYECKMQNKTETITSGRSREEKKPQRKNEEEGFS